MSSEKISPIRGKEGLLPNSPEQPHMDAEFEVPGITCDGPHLLDYLRAGSVWLDRHVAQVNALNVFPVPDGDTGTNMSLTMRAALAEVNNRAYSSVSELAHVIAHGALMGARGNSGVILSQILRGFARALDGRGILDSGALALAFHEGAATAYKGVMKPVEGTILTVAREAAEEAGRAASEGATTLQMLARTLAEAQASLARTPQLLPVLASAGVVDAGGQGLIFILEGVLRQLRGEGIECLSPSVADAPETQALVPEGEYNYDTQFVLQGHDLDVEAIRRKIASMGDSVLVVGDNTAIKVHVHSDDPGAVISYGVTLGQLTTVIVENMQLQYQDFRAHRQSSKETVVSPSSAATGDMAVSSLVGPGAATTAAATRMAGPDATLPNVPPVVVMANEQLGSIGIVAVASGEGLQRIFESLGVGAIVSGGQTMNPSTQDLLRAVESLPCNQVILLPNNSNIILTAQQIMDLTTKQVRVVPAKTIPQGIAALLAFNYQADLGTNAEFMIAALKQVQTGEVTRAVRSAQVNGLIVSEGQIIGLLNDDLRTAGEDITRVVLDLLQLMTAKEHEILTIYYGQDVSAEQAHALASVVQESYPHLEVEVLDGGQPHYYYIISAE